MLRRGNRSADGAVVVGKVHPIAPQGSVRTWIWDEAHGPRDLAGVFTAAGVDLESATLYQVNDISADGCVVVGQGVTAASRNLAFRAVLP